MFLTSNSFACQKINFLFKQALAEAAEEAAAAVAEEVDPHVVVVVVEVVATEEAVVAEEAVGEVVEVVAVVEVNVGEAMGRDASVEWDLTSVKSSHAVR